MDVVMGYSEVGSLSKSDGGKRKKKTDSTTRSHSTSSGLEKKKRLSIVDKEKVASPSSSAPLLKKKSFTRKLKKSLFGSTSSTTNITSAPSISVSDSEIPDITISQSSDDTNKTLNPYRPRKATSSQPEAPATQTTTKRKKSLSSNNLAGLADTQDDEDSSTSPLVLSDSESSELTIKYPDDAILRAMDRSSLSISKTDSLARQLRFTLSHERKIRDYGRRNYVNNLSNCFISLTDFVNNTPEPICADGNAPNPFYNSTIPKGTTEEQMASKDIDKDIAAEAEPKQLSSISMMVEGGKAYYFWQQLEHSLREQEPLALRIMYQKVFKTHAYRRLKELTNAVHVMELEKKYKKGNKAKAHVLLNTVDLHAFETAYTDSVVDFLTVLWKDPLIQEVYGTCQFDSDTVHLDHFVFSSMDRVLSRNFTPQTADYEYLQILCQGKLRMVKQKREKIRYRIFGFDRITVGDPEKWGNILGEFVDVLLYIGDIGTPDRAKGTFVHFAELMKRTFPKEILIITLVGSSSLAQMNPAEHFRGLDGSKTVEEYLHSRFRHRVPKACTATVVIKFIERDFHFLEYALVKSRKHIVEQMQKQVLTVANAL